MLPPSPRFDPLLRLPLSPPLERPEDEELPLELLLPLERVELPLSLDGRLGRTASRDPPLLRPESPLRVLLPLPLPRRDEPLELPESVLSPRG